VVSHSRFLRTTGSVPLLKLISASRAGSMKRAESSNWVCSITLSSARWPQGEIAILVSRKVASSLDATGLLSCPKIAAFFGHPLLWSEQCIIFRTWLPSGKIANLRSQLLTRIASRSGEVWTPSDFADLGSRATVDKTLQRLTAAGELRRIDRGLYDQPRKNKLTGRPTVPDYRAIIRAVTRRDQARAVIDGMTAANDLGLTTAVPARIEVLVDARLKPIKLGKQEIQFKFATPSRLYWANRPAMRVVQALYWMHDMLAQPSERQRVQAVLSRLFKDPQHGQAIRDDLRAGLSALPIWMQEFLRGLLNSADAKAKEMQR
jgi:hypothetical protein